jgi:toluene monooxygenase system ferredoxin subunit
MFERKRDWAMQRHEIMPFDDLWIGEMVGVEVAGVKVLLLNVEDEIRAYLDRCPHRASLLSEGNLEGLTLTCATHLWEFNALSGRGINPESSQLIRFPVRIENGMIYVEIPETNAIPQYVDAGEE